MITQRTESHSQDLDGEIIYKSKCFTLNPRVIRQPQSSYTFIILKRAAGVFKRTLYVFNRTKVTGLK